MKTILIVDDRDFIDPEKAKQDINQAILFTGKPPHTVAVDYGATIVNGKLIKNRYGDLDMPIVQLFD